MTSVTNSTYKFGIGYTWVLSLAIGVSYSNSWLNSSFIKKKLTSYFVHLSFIRITHKNWSNTLIVFILIFGPQLCSLCCYYIQPTLLYCKIAVLSMMAFVHCAKNQESNGVDLTTYLQKTHSKQCWSGLLLNKQEE